MWNNLFPGGLIKACALMEIAQIQLIKLEIAILRKLLTFSSDST